MKKKQIERFWKKVDRLTPEECWPWKGCVLKPKGYGQVQWDGKVQGAHRVAFMLTGAVIPKGKLVCHICDNPSCVNPAHLFAGSVKDNAEDMIKKGRSNRGAKNGYSKLTEDEVIQIRRRRAEGESLSSLSESFDIHDTHIARIVKHQYWRHLV